MMTNVTENHVDPIDSGVDKSFAAMTVKINSFKKFVTKRADGYNYLYSDTVWLRGMPWQLRVDCDCRKGAENSFVDVFLFCKAENVPKNFDCLVRATFTIVSAGAEKSKDVSYRLKEHFVATQMAWGCTNLKRISDLIKPENEFLLHGALYINVSIIADKPFAQTSKSSAAGNSADALNGTLTEKSIRALDNKFAAQLKAVNTKFDGLNVRLHGERDQRLATEREAGAERKVLRTEVKHLRDNSVVLNAELAELSKKITESEKRDSKTSDSTAERLAALESKYEALLAIVAECKQTIAEKSDQDQVVVDTANDASSEPQDRDEKNSDSTEAVGAEYFDDDAFTQSGDEEGFYSPKDDVEDDSLSSCSFSSGSATSEGFEKLDGNESDRLYNA